MRGWVDSVPTALTSFRDSQVYSELIGAKGAASDRVETLIIQPSPNSVPVFEQSTDFIIRDKKPAMRVDPASSIHFSIKTSDSALPFIWTSIHDRGRFCGSRRVALHPVFEMSICKTDQSESGLVFEKK